MPGNVILVNGAIEYAVGDPKMNELIEWLDQNGAKLRDSSNETHDETD